jgi:hopanoid biosynthesis associated RND transporter like protein HpnN
MKTEQVPPEEAPLVRRLLVGLVDRVCRRPALVLAVALAACGLSAYAACLRLEYRTQRNDLMSQNKDYLQRWQKYVAEFGDDDDIVVVVKGGQRPRMRQALDALAAQVERQPEHFDRLFYKVDLRPLRNRALLFLSTQQIQDIQDNLRHMSRLLDAPGRLGWNLLTLHQLLGEAGRLAARLRPGQPLGPADDQFFTQLSAITRVAAAALADPKTYHNPWESMVPQGPAQQEDLLAQPQYFFSDKGTLAFLLVRPVKEQGSFTAAQKSVDALRAIVADVGAGFPDLELGLTGLPVLETDEMVASQNDTGTASWLALAGVGVLFLVAYRGFRNPLLTVGTLLVGTTWAMGWLTLTVGHLNILSATFAVMLIGMGDYGVLWVTRYEQNRAAGADVVTALRRTAAGGGPSIFTAALATALAFYAAMLADFQAVAELGWIAGCGVLLCAFSCFTVLPALLRLIDRRRGPQAEAPAVLPLAAVRRPGDNPAWLPALAGRPGWVMAAGLALTAVLGAFAFRVRYDHNLLNLQARGLDSVKWELTLIEHTAGASWHALSYVPTPEEALALKARYEQLPEVSRVVEVASLVPRDQDRKLGQLRDIQHRLHNLPEHGDQILHPPPDPAALRGQLDSLLAGLLPWAGAGDRSKLAGVYHALEALRGRLGQAEPGLAGKRLQEFERRMTGDLVDNLQQLRAVSTPAAITVADLPPSLRERYLGRSGQWLLRVFAKDCLWEHGPLQNFVDKIRTVDPEATGKPFSTLEGLQSLKDGFQWAGLYALAAIVAVFWADFRNVRNVLLALAPLAMGVVISLGIMGLFGLPLNPANMIAFPLILGVGAVYGVHVVHDYLVRPGGKPYLLSHVIGRAVLVMALTNMISFGTLTISRHRGLSGLGFTLALGVACCMLTALVFLPAVLRVLSARGPQTADNGRDEAEPTRRAA